MSATAVITPSLMAAAPARLVVLVIVLLCASFVEAWQIPARWPSTKFEIGRANGMCDRKEEEAFRYYMNYAGKRDIFACMIYFADMRGFSLFSS